MLVRLGVGVKVMLGVRVGVLVRVRVGVLVRVLVGVVVCVLVRVRVTVLVGVLVGVLVSVLVGVLVGVFVGVPVTVGVNVGVAVARMTSAQSANSELSPVSRLVRVPETWEPAGTTMPASKKWNATVPLGGAGGSRLPKKTCPSPASEGSHPGSGSRL